MNGGRPIGEIRLALREVLETQPQVHARALAQQACVGLGATRATLSNMMRAGEVEIIGVVPAERGRPAAVYRLVHPLRDAEPTPLQLCRADLDGA